MDNKRDTYIWRKGKEQKEVEMEGKNVFAPLFQLLLPVSCYLLGVTCYLLPLALLLPLHFRLLVHDRNPWTKS